MTAEALRFVLVGVHAGVVNVLARIVFNTFVPYEAAIALAFPVALTVAFTLDRQHVFQSTKGSAGDQYLRFAIVNLPALAQVWLASVALAEALFPTIGLSWHAKTIAHIIGVASPIVTSFLAYKYFVFGQPKQPRLTVAANIIVKK